MTNGCMPRRAGAYIYLKRKEMKASKATIESILIIEPTILADARGFFMETYKKSTFRKLGINDDFVQDNHSQSSRGVLRGLHYQLNPHAQGKLVRVVRGEVFDVAVDLRRGSPTYGKWFGTNLSAENKKMLYLPPGFAHGFYTISETADVLYKCTAEYHKESERGLIWNDPAVGIAWPIVNNLVDLLEKDRQYPGLAGIESNFIYGK
jgi:dTDP-4-dehydrorhamnose 3,5-epimerase